MSIRVVDPTCTECGKPLTDAASRAFRIGPECRKGMTTQELRAAMARAAAADDPFRIPDPRPASVQARVNNHNAHAAASSSVRLCARHEGELGKCALCKWEADPENAAAMVLREVRSWTFADRRAERFRVVSARYAHVTPWRAPERPRLARRPPTPPRERPVRPARPTGQMELL